MIKENIGQGTYWLQMLEGEVDLLPINGKIPETLHQLASMTTPSLYINKEFAFSLLFPTRFYFDFCLFWNSIFLSCLIFMLYVFSLEKMSP